MSMWLQLTFAAFVGFSSILHVEYNNAVPNAYADETCHLKQVTYYCNGSYDKVSHHPPNILFPI